MKTPVSLFAVFLLFLSNCQPNQHQEGQRLYTKYCANCHMDGGEGLSALIPPLSGNDYLVKNKEKLPCILRYGLKDTIVVNGKMYAEEMPGVARLSDIHITNILNYINNAWGDRQDYQLEEVQQLLDKCR
ncbi:MAG TPA: cytochrome c [Saprospiraceae bacterium]|nr:cytochrome c [Saprospiraceae bacterium]